MESINIIKQKKEIEGCGKRLDGFKQHSKNHWMNRCGWGILLCKKCTKKMKEEMSFYNNMPKDVYIENMWFGVMKEYKDRIGFIPFTKGELRDFIKKIRKDVLNKVEKRNDTF